ncbi:uncharacterized protein AMSG_00134 [Thecamonas trahens ATCC 50062]|uniref:Uncharacterized protein n=1 Tax=Thecamonas trahens ATCC 50062 TaxID=461836 RepID=A0A0L0D1B4_THETB|nr:hypothetical protein AMSG_00134 [Thecamonas trahens ATCC 50062]KNC46016.1 hypothetical protein AMSG_00134 [Thecamonas trahens ATCC 50062]|eukprot:XP_013762996.1 hypothetical protein AMSG_00134 [Thecamonas trahens ATCC 50062]
MTMMGVEPVAMDLEPPLAAEPEVVIVLAFTDGLDLEKHPDYVIEGVETGQPVVRIADLPDREYVGRVEDELGDTLLYTPPREGVDTLNDDGEPVDVPYDSEAPVRYMAKVRRTIVLTPRVVADPALMPVGE